MPATSLPAGTIINYVGLRESLSALANQGWLLCDGTSLDATSFPALFAAIGTTFGSASPDVFSLPDLRGMFLRGVDSGGGVDPDSQQRTSPVAGNDTVVGPLVGSRQGQQVINHQHNWNENFALISDGGDDISVQLAPGSPMGGNMGPQPTTNVDGGGSETRPSNVYVYYLIYAG